MVDYLHRCYALHGELQNYYYKDRSRRVALIEEQLKGVRSSKRLSYEDLEKIRNSEVWNADDFGYWPAPSEIRQRLTSEQWDFWNLPRNEDRVVQQLLDIFRQVELVSVILRFVVPEHYGIISPPVENVLGIGPFADRAKKYKRYLECIREIRDSRRGLSTAAQVDMALWVLQVGVLEGLLKDFVAANDYEELRVQYEQDRQLRAIRVGNLTRPLFEDLSRKDLADALLESAWGDQGRIDLAGQVAGMEFERYVRKIARLQRVGEDASLRDMVEAVRPPKNEMPVSWRNAVRTRNDAVHSRHPSGNAVRRLIDAMDDAAEVAGRC